MQSANVTCATALLLPLNKQRLCFDLERQRFRRKSLQEAPSVEKGAGRESAAAPCLAIENPLDSFAHERCRKGVDVSSSRGGNTRVGALPDNHFDQECLRRTS